MLNETSLCQLCKYIPAKLSSIEFALITWKTKTDIEIS